MSNGGKQCAICRDRRSGSALEKCQGHCGRGYHKRCMEKWIEFRDTRYCRDCRPRSLRVTYGGTSASSSGSGGVRLEDLLARLERLEAKLDAGFGHGSEVASKNYVPPSKNPPAYDTIVASGGGPPQFPPKVWTIIFGKLTASQLAIARLVCRRWNQIIGHSPALVDKLVLTFPRGTTLDKNCGPIQTLTKSPITLRHTRANFRELTIVGASTWWPSIGQNLLTLTIVDCRISIEMLLEILKATPALKRLTLSCGDHLFFRTIPEVTFTLQYLEHLTLANIRRVELLDIFKQISPLLKTLKLPGENRNEEFIVAAFRFIWAIQNTLEEVELAGEPAELWDRMTEAVGMQLKRVRVAAGGIEESRLVRLSEAFPTVEGLMTPTCRVGDKALATIGSNLCKLRHLDVTLAESSPTGSHQEQQQQLSFLKSMPELRTLTLRHCSSSTLPAAVLTFGNLKHPNLEALSLRGPFQQPSSGENWFSHFPNLRSVSLADCAVESWSDLFVPLTTQAKKLENLSLAGVKVRTAGSEYFPDYLERLVTLRLVNCDLSKDSLIMLFTLCPKLARIYLKGMAGVDDEVTLAICQYTRELQEIRVAGCPGLTDLFLEYLWNYYDELAVVDVVDCENVSSEALKELLGGDGD